MPIDVSVAEDQIYIGDWNGAVSFKDMVSAMRVTDQLGDERGEKYYVIIMDATRLKSVPFDVANINKVVNANERALGFLAVNPPVIGQILATMVGMISSRPVEVFDDLESAIKRARQIRDQAILR